LWTLKIAIIKCKVCESRKFVWVCVTIIVSGMISGPSKGRRNHYFIANQAREAYLLSRAREQVNKGDEIGL